MTPHTRSRLAPTVSMLFLFALASPLALHAGNLDSPAAPTAPGSAMYTLEDLYNRLDTGAAATPSVFAEPSAGPGSTGHTLDQIMNKAPATDANGAGAAEVLSGKSYWGQKASEWGPQTGTMPNRGAVTVTPGTTQQAIPQGYHNGSGSVEGDADLVTGNIKAGANLFGVPGKTEVVDTTTGDAAAGDMLTGKKAWVDGAEVTGALATQTLSPANDTVAAGYYDATTLSGVDADLSAANIKVGATVFGVGGTVVEATGDATAGQVLAGTTFSKAGAAGLTGTMPNNGAVSITPSTSSQTIAAGFHNGSGSVAGDSDLVTGNIKAGVNLFGVNGKTEVVDTTTGTGAAAADVLAAKTAFVNGAQVTGSRPLAPGARTQQTAVYQAGDDGSYQKGVASPNPRFTNNGNGTVTDNLTGLMWTQNANLYGQVNWSTAINNCEGLTYGPYSDWRLPNLQELQGLIDYAHYNPSVIPGHPFTAVEAVEYWSSTTLSYVSAAAWVVSFFNGDVNGAGKTETRLVWPVRGGL